MTAFHEVSLPLAFALGASGGLERRVDVVTLGSGREARNTPWAHGRRRYDIGGAVRTLDDLHALLGFFEGRRGPLHGFRMRDPFDHKSCAPSASPAPTDQAIGVGDGVRTDFPLAKIYSVGLNPYARAIVKPAPASVRVALEGVEVGPGGFSVDTTTGVVSFASAPALGAGVSAGFLFDTPVRFEADRLDISLDGFGAGRAPAVALVEIQI